MKTVFRRRLDMNRIDRVRENHNKGYNCAQAVACAYCDLCGIGEAEAFRGMEGFGGGMSTMSVCGAVSAMVFLAGLASSDANMDVPKSKGKTYKLVREMTEAFLEKNKSTICREIKGVDTGKVLRSCSGCMEDAAEIIEKILLGGDKNAL